MLAWTGSAAAALILLAAFLLWRLLQGPIALDGLAPYIAAALDRSAPGWHVTIAGVRVGLDRATRHFDLRVEGVRLSQRGGAPLASFPEMQVSFSLRDVLLGELTPSRLVIDRPGLRLVRDKTGAVRFHVGGETSDAPGLGLEQAILALASLHRVAVRDATVVLVDRPSGRIWDARAVDFTATATLQGVAGDLSLALPVGGRTPELHADYHYVAASRAIDVSLEFGEVVPAALAPLLPQLAPLKVVEFPVFGSLETRIDLGGQNATGFRLDLGFGSGQLATPLLPDGVLRLQGGDLHAAYAPETGALRLPRMHFDLGGGTRIRLHGEIDGLTRGLFAATAAPVPGQLTIGLENVPIARFASLWPTTLSPGGRRWVVANIEDGVLDAGSFALALAVDMAAPSAKVVSARGNMHYHGLTIDYFSGLPAIRKVAGTAWLDGTSLEFAPTGGTVEGIGLKGGSVLITNLGGAVEWLLIDAALAGPIREALGVIDAPPLHYARRIGLDPARVSGNVDARLHFKLPLLKELKLDQVDYAVKARLDGVGISQVALGGDLADGKFSLDIGRAGVRLAGTGRFAGAPATLDATLPFAAKSGPQSRYRIALPLDDSTRQRLGLDFLPGRIEGPVGVDLTYSTFAGGRAEGVAALDLAHAKLTIPEARWQKPAAVPASAHIAFDLQDERVTRLPRIEMTAPGLDGRFALQLMPDGKRIERLDIRHFAVADDDVGGSLARRRAGGWHLALTGTRLDVSPLLKEIGKQPAGGDAKTSPPIEIQARLGRLILGPKRELRDVSAELLRAGERWRQVRLDGRFADGRTASLALGGTAGEGGLSYTSDDLGATLALLDVTGNVAGGRVTVRGQVGDDGSLSGHIDGKDYSLVGAPVVARLLSLASLSGLAAMLTGSGIPFSTLRGDFTWQGDRLVFDDLIANGGALGATANGSYDLAGDRFDLQGTIVPAYTLNSLLGNLPVLGSLLLGGKGQGLFAANYRLSGTGTDPRISVNPLSVLTPGFLRRLMQPNFGLAPPAGR